MNETDALPLTHFIGASNVFFSHKKTKNLLTIPTSFFVSFVLAFMWTPAVISRAMVRDSNLDHLLKDSYSLSRERGATAPPASSTTCISLYCHCGEKHLLQHDHK